MECFRAWDDHRTKRHYELERESLQRLREFVWEEGYGEGCG